MTVDWTHELLEQFDLQWNLAHGPSLETLTDEEYLWQPVPGCWSIRPTGPGGRGQIEQGVLAGLAELASTVTPATSAVNLLTASPARPA